MTHMTHADYTKLIATIAAELVVHGQTIDVPTEGEISTEPRTIGQAVEIASEIVLTSRKAATAITNAITGKTL